ncbi:MAG TPA: zf-HC2 domain-containing protein [Chthonomonadaceae bacterium]|nr:zf-HC2 domain-containing protein [Chthonomonadaceae bacterium]
MFDRCRRWRGLLSRRADGVLPMAQWGALEDHLAHCPRCQAAAEADRIRESVLREHTGMLDSASARRFDNQILATLRQQPAARPALLSYFTSPAGLRARRQTSFDFLSQIMGGALVAAAVTALCLLSALQPNGFPAAAGEKAARHALLAPEHNELPVPLESLLRSPSPRAALLWTTPSPRKADASASRPAALPTYGPHARPAPPRPAVPPASQSGSRGTDLQMG